MGFGIFRQCIRYPLHRQHVGRQEPFGGVTVAGKERIVGSDNAAGVSLPVVACGHQLDAKGIVHRHGVVGLPCYASVYAVVCSDLVYHLPGGDLCPVDGIIRRRTVLDEIEAQVLFDNIHQYHMLYGRRSGRHEHLSHPKVRIHSGEDAFHRLGHIGQVLGVRPDEDSGSVVVDPCEYRYGFFLGIFHRQHHTGRGEKYDQYPYCSPYFVIPV